jgi:thioester reductase-like protein
MGKVFIERLLRDTKVKKILILIRTKKDKSAEVRLEELFNDPVSQFNLIHEP